MSTVAELKIDPKLLESPEHKAASAAVFQVLGGDLTDSGHKANVPSLPDVIKPVPVAIKPEKLPGIKRVSYRMHQRLSDYTASYYVTTGEKRSWYMAALRQEPGDAMPRAEALDLATKTANLPPDAVLQIGEYDTHGGAPVFIARWSHVVRNIPVEQDYIQVLINGNTKKVFSFHKRWHQVDPQAKVR